MGVSQETCSRNGLLSVCFGLCSLALPLLNGNLPKFLHFVCMMCILLSSVVLIIFVFSCFALPLFYFHCAWSLSLSSFSSCFVVILFWWMRVFCFCIVALSVCQWLAASTSWSSCDFFKSGNPSSLPYWSKCPDITGMLMKEQGVVDLGADW